MVEKKLIDFLKNNFGYITTKEIEQLGISKISIPELVSHGLIRKVARGIYIDSKLIEDEFYILQKRYSNIIFSYNTACYLLGLSDRAPYKLDVTTISHKKIRDELNIHYVSEDKLNIGVISINSPYGNPIKIYNAERCICDIMKNSKEVDMELYNKIINNYFKQENKNLSLLEDYSKLFNVHEKFEHIMEVLI